MKTLDELIAVYSTLLQAGEIQAAYRGILGFLGKLRAALIKKYPQYEVSSFYQGYMDMSYFSLSTKALKDKGLKIAVVYLHEKGAFEAWLSARNRDVAKTYASMLKRDVGGNLNLFHDESNSDAILECSLISNPSFEDQDSLIETIDQSLGIFVKTISDSLSIEF